VRTDRQADQLARIAASATEPQSFDSAARALGLKPETVQALEGQPVLTGSGVAPGASAFAFSGARPGESSDLLDSENAYFLVRLDSLFEGGTSSFEEARSEIRSTLVRRKQAEALLPRARDLAQAAASSTLEAAASARDVTVQKSGMFNRPGFVAGLGRLNEAIGAAFSLPLGVVSEPIVTDEGVFVMRVDQRVEAKREAFEQEKQTLRRDAVQSLRQARVQLYLQGLREQADVDDRRKQINAAARQQTT
jgi:hypothetical protein